ncbi:MAG: hypothetical protein VKJ24_03660, partial [Synechococcales bacterium]|nr:hypothetical protein [Synechococcales bacterium]
EPTLDLSDLNRLHQLGNQAIQLGLISGHGYHHGYYELICKGEVITLSLEAAKSYLITLIQPEASS